ncbi:uncharacterized protein LOC129291506 [Prosopis cineraria]|uniref:uncharacterized protein LOC129291506 n=1 Tax=Prosopis cineraria TaxID=364024 RepID=UPI00241019D4|nr:uncharacterized protein LOC129291506 [Prosopis cineraria]
MTLFKRKTMSQFSLSHSCKCRKIQSFSLMSHLFNVFFFIFLSPYLVRLFCSFSPLFSTTLFLLALLPPNLAHDNDDSSSSDSKLAFLLSVVESLVQKISSKNDENGEGIRCFEEFQAYLDVFRAPVFEVLGGNCSESVFPGHDGGRESRAHVGPMGKKPNGSFDENPFGEDDDDDDGKFVSASPIVEENLICEKQCNEVLEENYSKSGLSGDDDGRESRNHVGPLEKEPNVSFDEENPFEKDNGKMEASRPFAEENNEVPEEKFSESDCSGEEGRFHVGLVEDPTVNLEEKSAGVEDDVDKVEKNSKPDGMFCQKRDKEVKPLDTNSNKAEESKEEKVALRSGSKVTCNNNCKIDAKDSSANGEEEEEEEYFGTPERFWDYNRSSSYGSMRKEKKWRRTLAFKLYEERNNVDNGSSSSEAMDLLWETYEDREHDKAEESTKSEEDGNDEEDGDEDEKEEEKEEKEKGMESKYCCLQALKFSAGKVNLGMRKPSLVKISKALKSIGLFHHVSKHGRKNLH